MNVQVIMREGQPEYAVLPWEHYQALLLAAGQQVSAERPQAAADAVQAAAPTPWSQLKGLRESKGLSVEALARSVGISPHYLALIEQGERAPDSAIARSLARALDVTAWEAQR